MRCEVCGGSGIEQQETREGPEPKYRRCRKCWGTGVIDCCDGETAQPEEKAEPSA